MRGASTGTMATFRGSLAFAQPHGVRSQPILRGASTGALGVDIAPGYNVSALQWYRIICFLALFISFFILAVMSIWRYSHMQLSCEKPLPHGFVDFEKHVPHGGLSISNGIDIVLGLASRYALNMVYTLC